MNKELEELRNEVKVLKERVNVIERRERNRKTRRIIAIIFKVILYAAILIAIWIGYQYITNIPSLIGEKIKEANPLSGIDLSNLDISKIFGN